MRIGTREGRRGDIGGRGCGMGEREREDCE